MAIKLGLLLFLGLLFAFGAADEVSPYHDLALQFAPRLRFDSKQGDTLGHCLPGSAADYYALRKNGFTGRICNMDYTSILDGRVPVYYQAESCNDGTVHYISYWYFYGYKDDCPLLPGNPGGDVNWGRYIVKVLNGNLDRVIFYQHRGWYTRDPSRYETFNATHPVAYVGKLRQGNYHDDGGSGTCCYFEDYRNPGSTDKHIDSWRNLVWLRNDGTSNTPEWMTNNEAFIWNGESLPHFLGENFCDLRGCLGSNLQVCETCGCHKSDVKKDEIP